MQKLWYKLIYAYVVCTCTCYSVRMFSIHSQDYRVVLEDGEDLNEMLQTLSYLDNRLLSKKVSAQSCIHTHDGPVQCIVFGVCTGDLIYSHGSCSLVQPAVTQGLM